MPRFTATRWLGKASRCDPRPGVNTDAVWPEIGLVAEATGGPACGGRGSARALLPRTGPGRDETTRRATGLVLSRRSARRFTGRVPVPVKAVFAVLSAALPHAGRPGIRSLVLARSIWWSPFTRSKGCPRPLRPAARWRTVRKSFPRDQPPTPEGSLPLLPVCAGSLRADMRRVCCAQGIAAEGVATIVMGARIANGSSETPESYRAVHREAGAIGQALYPEAERRGLGTSVIGCFVDDNALDVAGLTGSGDAVIYAAALGPSLPDPHGQTQTVYAGRNRSETGQIDRSTAPAR